VGFPRRVRARLTFACTLALVACGAPFPTLTRAVLTPSPGTLATPAPAPSPSGSARAPIPGPTGPAPSIVHASPPAAAGGATPARPAPTTPNTAATPVPQRTSIPEPGRTPTPVLSPTTTPPKPPIPHFSKVIVILMENEEYSSIIGDPSAPYINSLAAGGALATQYDAVSHPSLPNYLALTGGSTFGVTTDCAPGPSCTGGRSVVEEMAAAGIGWRAYMEDMPGPCAQADSGGYAVHHDPFVYYNGVVAGSCTNVVPATQLPGDIAAGALPAFTWLTPNLCNDMHDCPVATGDAYLAGIVPQLLGTLGPDGALFLVWDEGTSNTHGGGQVTMVAAGSGVKRGYRSSLPYDHYSLLRTIEDAWGLPQLGNSAAATPMADLFS
jgi:phosphatidylinositol-3-phosphatase